MLPMISITANNVKVTVSNWFQSKFQLHNDKGRTNSAPGSAGALFLIKTRKAYAALSLPGPGWRGSHILILSPSPKIRITQP